MPKPIPNLQLQISFPPLRPNHRTIRTPPHPTPSALSLKQIRLNEENPPTRLHLKTQQRHQLLFHTSSPHNHFQTSHPEGRKLSSGPGMCNLNKVLLVFADLLEETLRRMLVWCYLTSEKGSKREGGKARGVQARFSAARIVPHRSYTALIVHGRALLDLIFRSYHTQHVYFITFPR